MTSVSRTQDGRIDRLTHNRPDVLTAIDDDLAAELAATLAQA